MPLDVESGLLRIAKGMRIVGKGWAILVFGGTILALLLNKMASDEMGLGLMFGVAAAILPAGVLYGAAWIIEGFVRPSR